MSKSAHAIALSSETVPNKTHSGYLDVNKQDGSKIFYTYYEAQEVKKGCPILLWLQVCTKPMARTSM